MSQVNARQITFWFPRFELGDEDLIVIFDTSKGANRRVKDLSGPCCPEQFQLFAPDTDTDVSARVEVVY